MCNEECETEELAGLVWRPMLSSSNRFLPGGAGRGRKRMMEEHSLGGVERFGIVYGRMGPEGDGTGGSSSYRILVPTLSWVALHRLLRFVPTK